MRTIRCALCCLAAQIGVFPAQAANTANTQYLFFQIFTYPGFVAPLEPIPPVVQNIVGAIGTTGTSTQRLGFVAGPLTFDHTNAQLIQIIDQAFTAADVFNVAFMLHIDDSMFWINRQDLWSQNKNIEWTSWSGTPSGRRIAPWYTAAALAPQMCYNSPGIKAAITTQVTQVIGPEIQKDLALLTAKGKGNLFAGVIVGWETQLPDVTPAVGYCALTNLGYSAANPPPSMSAARITVVYDFIEFWEQQFIAAGIASSKLFSHIAVPPPGVDNNNAPPASAFSPYNLAGFSAYGTEGSAYPQIYEALEAQSNKGWGVSEGSNIYPPNAAAGGSGQPDEPMVDYLGQAFYNCATYVNLFGWQSTGSPFQSVLTDATAIDAYRLFLQGAFGVPPQCASQPASRSTKTGVK